MKSFINFVKGIVLRGESTDPTDNTPGSIWHNSITGRIKSYVQGAVREVVSTDQSQTLTNKSVDGSTNTLTNIPSSAISSVARNKIAAGTPNQVITNDASGNLSSEAALAKVRGGTGVDNSLVTFPSTGVVVTEAGIETLTNKTLTTPNIGVILNTGTLTLPVTSDTLVGRATTDTLTNKTLTNPVITGATGITKTDVGLANVDNTSDATKNAALATLSNKSLQDTTTTVVNTTDPTKKLKFDLAGLATGVTTTLQSNAGISNTITFPSGTDVLVARNATAILTNKTIDGLNNSFVNIPTASLNGTVSIFNGGTGASTKAAGFDALSPMTTSGDLIYGGAAGTGTRLSAGLANQVLKTVAGVPTWASVNLSGINYIGGNPDAEADTSGWVTYNDTISQPQLTLGSGTVDEVGDYINVSSAIGVVEGQSVVYTTNGSVIGGLVNATTYIIRNPLVGGGSSSSFQLSNVGSTSIINLTSDGAGTHIFSLPTPYDGTGGTANITWTRSTVSPLRGTASFVLTKDAVNRQGQGVGYAFTIDAADVNKILTISADYLPGTGYASGDLGLYIQDVTSGTIINPTVNSIDNILSIGKIDVSFQTSSSLTYRLMLHVQSPSAVAYTTKLDNISVGPQPLGSRGVTVTDWVAYTPSLVDFGNGTAVGFYRRIGDSIEARVQLTSGTVVPTGFYTFSIPSGLSFDLTKIPSSSQGLGNASYYNLNTGASFVGAPFAASVTTIRILGENGQYIWNQSTPQVVPASNGLVSVTVRAPISGWTSNVQMSSDVSGRATYLHATTGTSFTTAGAQLALSATTDEQGLITGGNSIVIKQNGPVVVEASVTVNNGATAQESDVTIRVNGVGKSSGGSTGNYWTTMTSRLVYNARAGDVITFVGHNVAFTSGITFSDITVISISAGSQQIAATETIAAHYNTAAGQSLTNAATTTVIYGTKEFDTHNAMNTATGVYTAPASGTYRVSTSVYLNSAAWGVNGALQASLVKNGSTLRIIGSTVTQVASSFNLSANGSTTVKLIVGETINIGTYQNSGAAVTLIANGIHNWVSIERVGV